MTMSRPNSPEKPVQIVAAGTEVVLREGIWNTTTRKLAAAAGISLATLHYHFENKEALLSAIFHSMIDAIRASVREVFATPMPLTERIELALGLSWKAAIEDMRQQLLYAEMTLYAARIGDAAWLGQRQYEAFVSLYVDMLAGPDRLGAEDGLDIEGLARFILAAIDGVLIQHFAEPDAERSQRAIDRMVYLAHRFPLAWRDGEPEPVSALTLGRRRE